MRTSVAAIAMLASLCAAGSSNCEPNTNAAPTSRHYSLPATPANVQWGCKRVFVGH